MVIDISNIEEVFGSPCLDFTTNLLIGDGACNNILIFTPPFLFPSDSCFVYSSAKTLSLVKHSF